MTEPLKHPTRSVLQPIVWGVLIGAIQVASPLAMRWLDPATVHALYIAFIAAVYVGFAVADGRTNVIIVETIVAAVFLVLALVGVTASGWVLVAGYAAHGAKDFWQHRTQFVANTRWWPPFCAAVDFLVAAVLAVGIASGHSLL
ncbi:MAG: hypothetical protein ABI910_04175 [Gemmatimonadota bacterium]